MMTEIKNSAVDRFVAAARSCVGTKFHHQGRLKFVGLDCIGLIVLALRAVDYSVKDELNYGLRPDGKSLVASLKAHGACPVSKIRKGDILLFRFDDQPQHVAIATSPTTLIHAFAPAGCVVETQLGFYWKNRLLEIFRFNLDIKKGA